MGKKGKRPRSVGAPRPSAPQSRGSQPSTPAAPVAPSAAQVPQHNQGFVPGQRRELPGPHITLQHLPINQRVLYEVPAPTVALYTLLAMSAVVIPAYLIFDRSWPVGEPPWLPIIGLTSVTIFSRVALFLGVKKIGGMQTALLGLAQLLIAIFFKRPPKKITRTLASPLHKQKKMSRLQRSQEPMVKGNRSWIVQPLIQEP